MSDPVTNIEIEDVLSSIRRLVSDEGRGRAPVVQPKPAAPRLVLTPSLRVTAAEPAPNAQTDLPAGAQADAQAGSGADPSPHEPSAPVVLTAPLVLTADQQTAAVDPQRLSELSLGSSIDDFAFDDPDPTARPEPDTISTETRAPETRAPETRAPETRAPEPPVAQAPVADTASAPPTVTAAVIADPDMADHALERSRLKDRIADLEAAIGQAEGDWEPDLDARDQLPPEGMAEQLGWRDAERSKGLRPKVDAVIAPVPARRPTPEPVAGSVAVPVDAPNVFSEPLVLDGAIGGVSTDHTETGKEHVAENAELAVDSIEPPAALAEVLQVEAPETLAAEVPDVATEVAEEELASDEVASLELAELDLADLDQDDAGQDDAGQDDAGQDEGCLVEPGLDEPETANADGADLDGVDVTVAGPEDIAPDSAMARAIAAEVEAGLSEAHAAESLAAGLHAEGGAPGSQVDPAVLRALVAEIVREELQGALGERITRNVRKLVRREIHRALTAQDLD